MTNSCKVKNNEEYCAATLVFPEWIDYRESSRYTTDVCLYIHDNQDMVKDINRQLDDIDGELLLFLNITEELIEQKKKRYAL